MKLIDLGAAADLRIGINYVPNEFLLDPRYAPPQQYIMSTSTPRAPPIPVAATLSPILWRLNNPDRFDMYSAGMALLQMSFPNLRSDNNLIAFNRRLETFQWDLTAWRKVGRPAFFLFLGRRLDSQLAHWQSSRWHGTGWHVAPATSSCFQ